MKAVEATKIGFLGLYMGIPNLPIGRYVGRNNMLNLKHINLAEVPLSYYATGETFVLLKSINLISPQDAIDLVRLTIVGASEPDYPHDITSTTVTFSNGILGVAYVLGGQRYSQMYDVDNFNQVQVDFLRARRYLIRYLHLKPMDIIKLGWAKVSEDGF